MGKFYLCMYECMFFFCLFYKNLNNILFFEKLTTQKTPSNKVGKLNLGTWEKYVYKIGGKEKSFSFELEVFFSGCGTVARRTIQYLLYAIF
jgi:hypothetical protein